MSEMKELDFSRLIRLSTEDFKYTATLGVFGGWADLAVFENEKKAAPVVKLLMSYTFLFDFKSLLLKALADPEMKSVELGWWPFNRDLKIGEFKSSVSVGRDENHCIYLDLISAEHKSPIRMLLITDRSIRINNQVPSKQAATESGARTMVNLIDGVMNFGIALSRKAKEGNGYAPVVPASSNEMGF